MKNVRKWCGILLLSGLLLLAACMVLSFAGCSGPDRASVSSGASAEPGVSDAQDAEILLSRSESRSVYGVEAPSAEDGRLLVSQEIDQVPSEPSEPEMEEESAASQGMPEQGEAVMLAKRTQPAQPVEGEARGVWFSYLTLGPLAKNKTQAEFTSNIDTAFGKIADEGFNTVFAQVRPFADALYQSDYFPWSYLLTGTEGENPGYDPLEIMCEIADKHGLRIEAWINPYRVRLSGYKDALSSKNQARKWLKSGSDSVVEWNGGIYYNPGSAQARALIVNGVKEIVANYNVDGIHFDDYFYPTTDMAFDQATWRAAKSSLPQADWRRENVNQLVREVYTAVKSIDPNCLFGISPQGNTQNNYNGQFIDVEKWLANPGYLDYICPQIYYGFENGTNPYAQTVEKWDRMIKVPTIKLYVGIAAYKLGTEDQWAGAGSGEWLNTEDILARMVETARKASHYGGFAIYSYDSLFSTDTPQVRIERENLKKIL